MMRGLLVCALKQIDNSVGRWAEAAAWGGRRMPTHNQRIGAATLFYFSSVQLNQMSNSSTLAKGPLWPLKGRSASTSISAGDEDVSACDCTP